MTATTSTLAEDPCGTCVPVLARSSRSHAALYALRADACKAWPPNAAGSTTTSQISSVNLTEEEALCPGEGGVPGRSPCTASPSPGEPRASGLFKVMAEDGAGRVSG